MLHPCINNELRLFFVITLSKVIEIQLYRSKDTVFDPVI